MIFNFEETTERNSGSLRCARAYKLCRSMSRCFITDNEAGHVPENNWVRNICGVKREDRSKMNELREETGVKTHKEESNRKQNETGKARGKNG